MELIDLEVYNDLANQVRVRFRTLHASYPNPGGGEKPFLTVILDEVHTGSAGNYTVPFTITADNDIRVPVHQVVNGVLEPVMENTGRVDPNGNPVMAQTTIGAFDMWILLVFKGNHLSIEQAIVKHILMFKGLDSEPFLFVMPETGR